MFPPGGRGPRDERIMCGGWGNLSPVQFSPFRPSVGASAGLTLRRGWGVSGWVRLVPIIWAPTRISFPLRRIRRRRGQRVIAFRPSREHPGLGHRGRQWYRRCRRHGPWAQPVSAAAAVDKGLRDVLLDSVVPESGAFSLARHGPRGELAAIRGDFGILSLT